MNATVAGPKSVFYFYITPEFTMLAFTTALETLRLANQVLGREKYAWQMVSADGKPVRASCGLQLGADLSLDEARARTRASSARMVVVCSGQDVERYASRSLASWLRECRKARIALGAVCTGAHLLAHAGILNERRCTIHWENLAAFSERFSNVQPSPQIFAVDDEIYTCAGGTSPLEMMLEIIGREDGTGTAAAICQLAIVASLRDGSERQRLPYMLPLGIDNPNLRVLVEVMEENVADPIPLALVAARGGISRRQMERYFRDTFNCSPGKYYMRLRIERARSLLRQTTMPVIEIAVACGFVSASHFSKMYRNFEGTSPHESRARRKQWPAHVPNPSKPFRQAGKNAPHSPLAA